MSQSSPQARTRLRVGVVGAGRWAIRSHIPGWQRDPRVEVVALADTDSDALASAGAEFGIARQETDYRKLVEDPDIDDSDTILQVDRLPKTMTVIGGGVIGCEYASMFCALGVKVTRIATGVPVGSDLEYADEVTMGKSMEGRREV